MSLSLDTVLQAVELVKKAVEIYRRVEGLPKQMGELGRRLEKLGVFLARLQAFVKAKPDNAYDGLFAGQKEELGRILAGIKDNVTKAHDLFERYEQGIVSRQHDIQFRVKWAAQLWFSLVDSTPDKVEVLMEDIDRDRAFVSDYLGLLSAQGIEHVVNVQAKGRTASPSPPLRRDYTVLFVDPYNVGRSIVAEAWVGLFMNWTLKSKGDWRIEYCRSAGFFVKNRSDCVAAIEQLDYTYKSFKKPLKEGGVAPEWTPLAALFENKTYEYPYKKLIEDKSSGSKSRGITKTVFQDYDFIIVFTNREHENMIKLKAALVKQGGQSIAPRGKGRLLMLGAYLSPPTEILEPHKNNDGTNNRENWEKGVAQIKTAVEAFLREELEWQQPGKDKDS